MGTYISDEIFDRIEPHELSAWKLKMKGLKDDEIALRLKIRKSTLQSYFSAVRSTIRRVTGVDLRSTDALVERFRSHSRLR